MEAEGQINNVNDDCILHILNWLRIEDILSFGSTSSRFQRIVVNRYGQDIAIATIKLNFDEGSTRDIIRLFGQQIRLLELYFHQSAVPADLFAIPSAIIDLRLCAVLRPLETGFRNELIDEIVVSDWLTIYQQSSVNILNLINGNNGNNMAFLRFKLSVDFDEDSFIQFHDFFHLFEAGVHWANINLFQGLRRGNVESDWARIPDANRFKFNLNFRF